MTDRYCPNCGSMLTPEISFCHNCGEPVHQEAPRPQQSLQPVRPDGTAAAVRPGVIPGPVRNNDKILRWALGVTGVLVMGLLGLLLVGYLALSLGAAPLLAGMVLATLPVPLYLTLALWLDRYEKEPIWMLAGAFLWGATVATFFSLIFNTINQAIAGSLFGAQAGAFFGTAVSAPLVEETSKGLALLILFLWKKNEFDGVIDGIVYAAMVGLGFAMVENFLYYGGAIAEGAAQQGASGATVSGLFIFVVRGVLTPYLHPIFTSMTGIGLGLARQSSNRNVKFLAPVIGLLAAIILHSLWNGSSVILGSLGLGLLALPLMILLLMVPAMLAVLAVVYVGLRREGRIVRQNLAPELRSGLLSRQEYDSLSSVRGRLESSYRAFRYGGFGGWRARSKVDQAATELAFHRDRVARGIVSKDDAGLEATYVQLLRELKGRQSAG